MSVVLGFLLLAAFYAPGRLFVLLTALALCAAQAVRAWRRGNRWPAADAMAIILAAGALSWHAAAALRDFRDARKAEPPRIDGTYEGAAEGLRGPIRVRVVVTKGRISDVRILSWCDSPSIAGEAVEETRQRILAEDTPRVRRSPGAPVSTAGLCRAVEEALWSARGPRLDRVSEAVFLFESNVPRRTTFTTLFVLGVVFAAAVALAAREAP